MRYWMVDSQRAAQGPFEEAEIERRILTEGIEPTRLVCPEGGQAWIEAREAFPAVFAARSAPRQAGSRGGAAAPARPPTTPPPPRAGVPSQPSGPGALGYVVPVGVEPCSLAAGYLGLFSLLGGCAAPFALGFAVAGLVRLRTRPHLRGHVRCAIGILGGLLGAAIFVLILIARSRN